MRSPAHLKSIIKKIDAFLESRNRVSDDCLALLREVVTALRMPEMNKALIGYSLNAAQERIFKQRQTIGRLKQALWETDKKRMAAEVAKASFQEAINLLNDNNKRLAAENAGLRQRLDNAEASLMMQKGVA